MSVEAIGIMWIVAIILFALIESLTYQIVSIWFAAGAVGSFIAYLLGADFMAQIVIFLVISGILVLFTRPLAMKVLKPNGLKTNVDSAIGKEGIVTEEINNLRGTGALKLSGVEWTARSCDDTIIPKGKAVRIKEVEGVRLIVESLECDTEK